MSPIRDIHCWAAQKCYNLVLIRAAHQFRRWSFLPGLPQWAGVLQPNIVYLSHHAHFSEPLAQLSAIVVPLITSLIYWRPLLFPAPKSVSIVTLFHKVFNRVINLRSWDGTPLLMDSLIQDHVPPARPDPAPSEFSPIYTPQALAATYGLVSQDSLSSASMHLAGQYCSSDGQYERWGQIPKRCYYLIRQRPLCCLKAR